MTVNFYIDGQYIGCGSYDPSAGLYQSSVELGADGDLIENMLDAGRDYGTAGQTYFEIRR